jgi:hypothetical protein
MFLETSAKTAYNVVEAFGLSAQAIFNNVDKGGDKNIDDKVVLKPGKNNTNDGKKGCC